MRSSPFASASVNRHYARGAVGLLALTAAVVGAAAGAPAALALLIVTVVAWRGCPTCWAVGLMETRADEARACGRGSCGSDAGVHVRRAAPRARGGQAGA